jgi:hypothetical protein
MSFFSEISEAHPETYLVGSKGFFPGKKLAGV